MEDKKINELAQDMMITLFGVKPKSKRKRFIPKYHSLSYEGVNVKWYVNCNDSIKIVNHKHSYERCFVLEDYKNEEEFIKSLIDKGRLN